MPNHWHLVLWPQADGQLSEFMHWLTMTHAQRLHAHRRDGAGGHVYQGRFKSFPVQEDEHFLVLMRYVERNALRAGKVARAEDWQWSCLWRRQHGKAAAQKILTEWPVRRPARWARQSGWSKPSPPWGRSGPSAPACGRNASKTPVPFNASAPL